MKPRFIIEQKITPFANQYRVFAANVDGSKASLAAYAHQKRMSIKEKVLFFSDEQKTQAVFSFRAEKIMDVHGRYFVEDENGKMVGMFKKEFAKSLIISTWTVMDAQGMPRYQISESSQTLAVLRRFGGQVPLVGMFVDFAMLFFKYHFKFVDLATNQEVGAHQKLTLFYDHYLMKLDDQAVASVDWRVWAAMGVGLDALQSR